MTVAEMRAALGLGSEVPDEEVVDLYAASLEDDPPAQATSLIGLDEVKRHLKLEVDDSSQDLELEGFLEAAIGALDGAEGWLGRAIIPRTYTHRVDCWRASTVRLPYPPIIAVTSVRYRGHEGADSTLDPDFYFLEGRDLHWTQGVASADGWHSKASVLISFRAGYEVLPRPLRAAILLMVCDLYRNRESSAAVTMTKIPMSTTVESLLAGYRVFA